MNEKPKDNRQLGTLILVISLLIALTILELSLYPMSVNDINYEMKSENIIFSERKYGIMIFITETDNEPLVYIFDESMFLPRFGLRDVFPHHYNGSCNHTRTPFTLETIRISATLQHLNLFP